MPFTPEMAERRFGYGLSPQIVPPSSVAQMLSGLHGADVMAQAYPPSSSGLDAQSKPSSPAAPCFMTANAGRLRRSNGGSTRRMPFGKG